MLKNKLED